MIFPRLLSRLLPLILAELPALAEPVPPQFLDKVPAGVLVSGADAYGPVQADPPVAPLLKGAETIGWASVTSVLVSTAGNSGRPIHALVAVDLQAHVTGVKLVKHS